MTSSGIVIKETYRFSKPIAEKLCTHLSNADIAPDDQLQIFKQGLLTQPYKTGNHYIVVVDYQIAKKEFGLKGGSIYVTGADAVFTMSDTVDDAPPHPYSDAGLRVTNAANVDPMELVYKLDLVDNSNSIKDKFTSINGDVYRLEPIQDARRPDGLYRYCKKPHDRNSHDHAVYETFFNIADLALAGVYNTADEAIYAGDIAAKKKEELLEKQHEATLSKIRAEASKHEAATASLEQQIAANEIKHKAELDMIAVKQQEAFRSFAEERKRSELKDYYEEKSYARKDSSEFTKHLPMIILGAGAALAAFMGLSAA